MWAALTAPPGAVRRDQRGQIWLHARAQQRQHVSVLRQQRHGCQLPLELQWRRAGGQIALPSVLTAGCFMPWTRNTLTEGCMQGQCPCWGIWGEDVLPQYLLQPAELCLLT